MYSRHRRNSRRKDFGKKLRGRYRAEVRTAMGGSSDFKAGIWPVFGKCGPDAKYSTAPAFDTKRCFCASNAEVPNIVLFQDFEVVQVLAVGGP